DREHGTSSPGADGCQETLKAGPRCTSSRTTKVIIDDSHLFPTQTLSTSLERVLATAAFRIVGELIGRRLSNVDKGAACQVMRRNFIHRPPPSRWLRCTRRGEP